MSIYGREGECFNHLNKNADIRVWVVWVVSLLGVRKDVMNV